MPDRSEKESRAEREQSIGEQRREQGRSFAGAVAAGVAAGVGEDRRVMVAAPGAWEAVAGTAVAAEAAGVVAEEQGTVAAAGSPEEASAVAVEEPEEELHKVRVAAVGVARTEVPVRARGRSRVVVAEEEVAAGTVAGTEEIAAVGVEEDRKGRAAGLGEAGRTVAEQDRREPAAGAADSGRTAAASAAGRRVRVQAPGSPVPVLEVAVVGPLPAPGSPEPVPGVAPVQREVAGRAERRVLLERRVRPGRRRAGERRRVQRALVAGRRAVRERLRVRIPEMITLIMMN